MSDRRTDSEQTETGKTPLSLRIVLFQPLYQGNVGSVCRVMKNFGLTELYLVRPCALEGEARAMASHAADVLRNAVICENLEEATAGCDVIIGTTGMRSVKGCDHIRTPSFSPGALRQKMQEFHPETKFALLFGREDIGFTNDELASFSLIATIPSSPIYPVMNLSHAVGIMAYELSGARLTGPYKSVSFPEFDAMCRHFDEMLSEMAFEPLKKEKMALMIRRIFARAALTPCETKTLRGIFRNIQYYVKKSKGETVEKHPSEISNVFEKEAFCREMDTAEKLRFKLRPWKKSDADSIAKYANNEKIAACLRNSFPSPYTLQEAEKFIYNILQTDESAQCFRAIDVGGRAVGSISISLKGDIYCKSAEIGYWLAEPFWGRGIMSEAVRQMCTEAFEKYDIVRIFAEPKADNTGSRKVLENAGFVLEGVLKKSVYKNDRFFDSCVYARLK